MKVGPTEYTLRTLGRVAQLQEMAAVTVVNRDGHTVTISDVGRSRTRPRKCKASRSLYNDTPCVLLNIRKQSGTNTVEIADAIKERVDDLEEASRPTGYRIEVVRDQSVFIRASVDTVKEHLMLGGFAGCGGRVPVPDQRPRDDHCGPGHSFLDHCGVRHHELHGLHAQQLTLLALTLSVGIVIDDAIVVMENIFRYIEEKNYTPFEAAVAATREIGLAVMAITLSLVAVFLPIAMMEGISGRFLQGFGVTMSATIIVSMLVSFTLTPMLAALVHGRPADEAGQWRSLAASTAVQGAVAASTGSSRTPI